MDDAKVKVYGAPWCPDCRRSKAFLGEMRVPYEWIDVDGNQEAQDYITELNDGKRGSSRPLCSTTGRSSPSLRTPS